MSHGVAAQCADTADRTSARNATRQRYSADHSGKIRDTHSVGSIGNFNLAVFAITEIATENADAVPPTHLVTGAPNRAEASLHRCRTPTMPLTRLTRRACW